MKIYFVRHGESEANVIRQISNRGWQHGLTPIGRQQAHVLVERLASVGARRIYSSPLRRAVETAEILSTGLGIPIEITDALREYDNGIVEGRQDAKAWQMWKDLREAWMNPARRDERIPEGESFNDIRARFIPWFERLIAQKNNDPLILMGHGGTYTFMLPLVLANIDQAFTLSHPFPNTGYVVAETRPEGIRCIEWCGEKYPDR